jgi:origin recognition complex subunit 3
MDRIPFALLFGIATSVELFNERLPRAASRCLHGAQFDVEQTSAVLENVFQKVIAGPEAPLRLGPELVTSLIERQYDDVQSIQAFTAALKVRIDLMLKSQGLI